MAVYPPARADATTRAQPHVVWTIWRMITRMAKALGPHKASRDGRWAGRWRFCYVERNPHANRSGTCCNAERRLAFDCWAPMEGLRRGYTYGRIEDALYAQCRDQIQQQGKSESDE